MDEEFLSEASSLLDLEMDLTEIDLKDNLRELGYFGDWNDKDNIIQFLQAEHYSKKIEQKKVQEKEGEIYQRLFSAIGSGTPPSNISQKDFFLGTLNKIQALVMKEIGEKSVEKFVGGKSLVDKNYFSPAVEEATNRLIDHLNQEYQFRRLVLLKRLDVTIQSFNWSQKAKQNSEEIIRNFQANRSQLDKMQETGAYNIGFEELITARENLLWDSKTSHGDKRCQTKLNAVIMKGSVPDRGGRADEQYFAKESFQKQEDDRNMPKFQPRQGQAHNPNDLSQYNRGGRGGGGRGGGRGRGGRGDSRGGFNNRNDSPSRGGFNNNRNHSPAGDHSNARGGYGRGRGRGRGRGQNPNVNYGDRGFQGKNF